MLRPSAAFSRQLRSAISVKCWRRMMKTSSFARRNPIRWRVYGHEGGERHALKALEVWGNLQPPGERTLNARFLDAGEDYVIVLWRQRGVNSQGEKFDAPVVSVYKMRGSKIVESQMFHADTKALVQFLAGEN
jgi:ketosteroid isomerase-like protein